MRLGTLTILLGSAMLLAFGSPGATLMAQEKTEASLRKPPEEGGTRRWEVVGGALDVRNTPVIGAEAVGRLPTGAVVSNLGCNATGDEVWCEIRSLRGGVEGFVPAKRLEPAAGPDGVVPTGVDDSKKRAKTRDFNSQGQIPCAQEQNQAMASCRAAVATSGGGDATIVVTFPNGFARDLYFLNGEFMRASATMSGVGTDTEWRLENDVYFIRVDDQRFEIPGDFELSD